MEQVPLIATARVLRPSKPRLMSFAFDTGVGTEAGLLARTHGHLLATQGSTSLGGFHEQVAMAISAVADEARVEDWDGEGGRAVSQECLEHALRLAALMPRFPAVPKVSADPDGEIAFVWRRTSLKVLVMSVGATGRIHYACKIDTDTYRAAIAFPREFPPSVREHIKRIYGNE